MSNPYVFIVGCPRSGTTLLQRMVNSHPRIAITYEAHWISRFFEKHRGLTPDGLVTEELIPLLLKDRTFIRMGIDREQLRTLIDSQRPISYSSFVTEVLDLYGQAKGKPHVGDKWPKYMLRINILRALWPKARLVHLIRDGRDVVLSLLAWRSPRKSIAGVSTWKEDAISTGAFWWESHVRLGRDAGNVLGPQLYCEVRYESLIARPAEELAALCDFLELPYDDVMVRFCEDRPDAPSDGGGHHPWMPVTPGLRNWRTEMAAEDVGRFEAAAGGLLDELGYARAFPHPRPESLAHAAKIREVLADDALCTKRFGSSFAKGVNAKAVA